MLSILKLYPLLRANESLGLKRHPALERNRIAKGLLYIVTAYYAACMVLVGCALPLALMDSGSAAYHRMDEWMWVLLIIDFWFRFVVQTTPAQTMLHYSLLPIRRTQMVHIFLGRNMLAAGNLFWGFLLVPFGVLSVAPLLGGWALVGWLAGYWLLIVANSLAYAFFRALILRKIWWVLVPVAIHLAVAVLAVGTGHNFMRMPCLWLMDDCAHGNAVTFLCLAMAPGILYLMNMELQTRITVDELLHKDEYTVRKESGKAYPQKGLAKRLADRMGLTGSYLKLEWCLWWRNKNMRVSLLAGVAMMAIMVGIQYATTIYDTKFMQEFICLYCYAYAGIAGLVQVMGAEGNYIDALMVRRESILSLLRAKFIFPTLLCIIPFVMLLPLVIAGKNSLWMNLGYLFFATGCINHMLLYLAAYNNTTIALNESMQRTQSNMTQMLVTFVVLFLPLGVSKLCTLALGYTWGYVLLMALGVVCLAAQPLWLNDIYQRFMKRRHTNMDAMRASRNQ